MRTTRDTKNRKALIQCFRRTYRDFPCRLSEQLNLRFVCLGVCVYTRMCVKAYRFCMYGALCVPSGSRLWAPCSVFAQSCQVTMSTCAVCISVSDCRYAAMSPLRLHVQRVSAVRKLHVAPASKCTLFGTRNKYLHLNPNCI